MNGEFDYKNSIDKWYKYYNKHFLSLDDRRHVPNIIKYFMDKIHNDKEKRDHFMKVYKFIFDYLKDDYDKSIKPTAAKFTERFTDYKKIYGIDYLDVDEIDEFEMCIYLIALVELETVLDIRNFNIPMMLRILDGRPKDEICKYIAYFKWIWKNSDGSKIYTIG